MITAAILTMLVGAPTMTDSNILRTFQVRPGTFGSGSLDRQKANRADAIEKDRLAAIIFLEEGRPKDALQTLSRWRDVVRTTEGVFLANNFYQAYVQLHDWNSAAKIARDQYDAHRLSKSTPLQARQVLRLATTLLILGEEKQAWEICEAHHLLFNESFFRSNLQKYAGTSIVRGDLGDALLRASAVVEGLDYSKFFYGKLILERPHDAEAYYLLSRSLPEDDLLSRKIHMEKAYELATGVERTQYKRELDALNSRIKLREKQFGGVGGSTRL